VHAIANDNLLSGVLLLGSFWGALTSGGVSVIFSCYIYPGVLDPVSLYGVAVILGFLVTGLVMQVVDSAVVCFFVCYAEEPSALRRHNPELYEIFGKVGNRNSEEF
jgi:hypothetical protein